MRTLKLILLFTVTGTILFISSCSKDDPVNSNEQAPTLPNRSTMAVDFSDFPDTNSSPLPKIFLTRNNWSWAALNVSVWNSVLTLTLAIPAAAFLESFNHLPVYQQDGTWLWQYSVNFQDTVYTAKLYGQINQWRVDWRMLLSKDGAYNDFEWFTGYSNKEATQGEWTLNKNPESPIPFLSIDWYRNSSDGTGNIKYTNIVPGEPDNGSYISYSKTNEVPYNRSYLIFGKEENRLTEIKWNYEQLFGRVKDQIHFLNQNWHCWDNLLNDIVCEE